MINEYVKYQQNGLPLELIAVINAKEDWIETENNCMKTILENYDITNNENDYILSKDIEEYLKERKIGVSMKKFGNEMKKYCKNKNYENVKNSIKKIENKVIRVWIGIK